MMDASYVPIMLRPGWVLERYYGWSIVHETAALKLQRKDRGPVRKFLLLARNASDDEISDAAFRHGLLRPLSFVVLNDFSSRSEEESRIVGGVCYRRATTSRWFGVGTFVLDLSENLDILLARMPPKERSNCRQAERLGVKVEFIAQPGDEDIKEFFALYKKMARERSLAGPRRDILQQMFAGRDLLMIRSIDSRGLSLAFNLVYLQGDQGCLLYSVRADGQSGGAGRYAHWETMKKLKAEGFRWYDLGLVASRDNSDGIYWFKRSFGGEFVDFGREYQHIPRGLAIAYRTFRALRQRLGKVL